MKSFCPEIRALVPIVLAALMVAVGALPSARAVPGPTATNEVWIKEIRGTAAISSFPATTWVETQATNVLHAGDRLRVGPNSVVTLLLSDRSVATFGAGTVLQIRPPHEFGAEPGLHLFQGLLYCFHRGEPNQIQVLTHALMAGIKGTEFMIEVKVVDGVEQTRIYMIDGRVQVTNDQGHLDVTNGQSAVATVGTAPVRTAGFIARNILQWCFYYPAVLDSNEVPLTAEERAALHESLEAYRSGDLLAALANYPSGRRPGSDAERVYYAGLLLSVGQVKETQGILSELRTTDVLDRIARLAGALRQLIAAVKREDLPSLPSPLLASEFLAASYYAQSRAIRTTSLEAALDLANRAKATSSQFGFAWVRAADLEFSFGRTARAREDLEKGLELTPTNAQALSLKGFLLAGQNRTREAIEQFNRALTVDAGLGNAWLGRGLCRIRRGDLAGGREDLLLAAAIEPERSLLRSYLGKAYANSGDTKRATHELALAKNLDPNDPTSWLYSALLNEQHNRINEAIRDLEKSQELNENRSVFRSGLLLDQDRAVRSANLARIYGEAGMDDVALREASRAVAADYGNFSAHLFLANSYEQLRQANLFDLRFETPAFSEYLLASLLGPADGRLLAQPVSQQEYTRLFERDTLGVSTSTEYLSRGAWSQYAAEFGTFGSSSFALEQDYNWDPGQTPNGSLETRQFSLKFKQMLTPRDGLFLEVLDFSKTSGDLAQRYNPQDAIAGLQAHETQEPSVLIGLDHRWSDTQHTLFLASRFDDDATLTNPRGRTFLLTDTFGNIDNFVPTDLTQLYSNHQTVNSFEVQHLITGERLQTVAGFRFQENTELVSNEQSINAGNAPNFESYFGQQGTVLADQSLSFQSIRLSPYAYEYWRVIDPVLLIGGLSYDYQRQPNNLLFGPLDEGTEIQRHLSPKAGLIWTPTRRLIVRAAYSQSLGGIDLDQSVRLEPAQLAGFVQSYRNLFPDSLVGGIGGARFETADFSLEYRFPTGTYVALAGELLRSQADQTVGAFQKDLFGQGLAIQLDEQLRFQERSINASVHQLLRNYFTVGARYQLSDAWLTSAFPDLDPSLPGTSSTDRGVLQLISLNGLFQAPCGLFAGVDAQYWSQALHNDLAGIPGDHFWQLNLEGGYRSPRRRMEVTLGLLNATGGDYRLYPINLYPDLPRSRTFFVRLQLNF